MPLPPMLNPGAVKRPLWHYADKAGVLRDWNGLRSAQGVITTDLGVVSLFSAPVWNPNTSATATLNLVQQSYTVRVWNLETLAFEDHDYPTTELVAGEVGNVAIADLILDPQLNPLPANLCKYRPHLPGAV